MINNGVYRMPLNYTSSELIQIGVPARNWEEAIRLSAEPLVKHGICLPEYVDDMVLNVIEHGPYIVLTDNLAVPHGRAETGALKTAISVGILKDPVEFGNKTNDPVRVVICMSALDGEKYMHMLGWLATVLEDRGIIEGLANAENTDKVLELLQHK